MTPQVVSNVSMLKQSTGFFQQESAPKSQMEYYIMPMNLCATQNICTFLYQTMQLFSTTYCLHITTALQACTVVVMGYTTAFHMMFIGATCQNMSETGYDVALIASTLKCSTNNIVQCRFAYLNTLFTFQVLTTWKNYQYHHLATIDFNSSLPLIQFSPHNSSDRKNSDYSSWPIARSCFFFQLGFPSVIQSDLGGKFLNSCNAQAHHNAIICEVYTSGFGPHLKGTTERVHRFLNSAIGIFCEQNQDRWEEMLQSAVYAHNTAPVSDTSDTTPFFLVFGCHTPSSETSLQICHQLHCMLITMLIILFPVCHKQMNSSVT